MTEGIRVDVYHHIIWPDEAVEAKFTLILERLTTLGDTMSALSDVVDQILASETAEEQQAAAALAAKDEIIANLQAQVDALGTQVTTALSQEAADAQTIADTRAALDAQAADNQTQIDRLKAEFPTAPTS